MQGQREERLAARLAECCRLLAEGDAPGALGAAQRAYHVRKSDPEVWKALADAHAALGDWFAAGFWCGMRKVHYGKGFALPMEKAAKEEMLRGVGYAFLPPQQAPFTMRVSLVDGELQPKFTLALGQRLPDEVTGVPGYWAGIYHDQRQREVRGAMYDRFADQVDSLPSLPDVTFDLMRADCVQDVTLTPGPGERYAVPIAGGTGAQRVRLTTEKIHEGTLVISKYETSFLRVEEPIRIASDEPYWLGEPIALRHDPRRRKLVLNILVDGLSWGEMKKEGCKNIPNIMKFFSKGTIFDDVYSGSEYTYPSLTTIETGRLPTTTQIFTEKEYLPLDADRVTLSEQMKALGYYCVQVIGESEGVYSGVKRGYDRILTNLMSQPAREGADRTIEQLEAFGETDLFLFVHLSDPHPNNMDMRVSDAVQTHLLPGDVVDIQDDTSVFLQATKSNQAINQHGIRSMDRQLGMLFRYIEAHYDDEDILVSLYSDHGCSIYSEKPWLLSNLHSNSALLMRGRGVPRGVRADELVSTADIYAILGHLCGFSADAPDLDAHLPEVFGGTRRDMVVSQSIFPGQTRKICLRTEDYACRIETEHVTEKDGTAVLAPYALHVYRRVGDEDEEVTAPEVRAPFERYLLDRAETFFLKGGQK